MELFPTSSGWLHGHELPPKFSLELPTNAKANLMLVKWAKIRESISGAR